MRKGKGSVTSGQYRKLYRLEHQAYLRKCEEVNKLRNQLHGMTVAHNKLLAEKKQIEANPAAKKLYDMLQVASHIPSVY